MTIACTAQRGAERGPCLGGFRLILRERRGECRRRLLAVRRLNILRKTARRLHELLRFLRERIHGFVHRPQRIQPREPAHLETRRRHRYLERTRLRLVPLQIPDHEFQRQQVACLCARLEEIPLVLDTRLFPRLVGEHRLLPRTFVHAQSAGDFRDAKVIHGVAAHVHDLVRREDEIRLRRHQFDGGDEVRLGTKLVFRAELVLKARLRGHEMNAIAATRSHRDFSREPAIRRRSERDGAARLPLLEEQFAALHRLARAHLQIDLRALQGDDAALAICHTLLRDSAIGGKMERLREFRDVGALAGVQQILPRERVAGLDAVADAGAADLHGRGKFAPLERLHVHDLRAALLALRLDLRAGRGLSREFHDHAHGVALRHDAIAAGRFLDDHLRPRDPFEIRPRQQRAQ